VVIISLDALYSGLSLRSDILQEFEGVLTGENLVIAASHTHFAPMLDETKPKLGIVDPDHYKSLLNRIVIEIRRMLEAPAIPVSLRTNTYFSEGIVSRRRRLRIPSLKYGFSGKRAFFMPRAPKMNEVRSEVIEVLGEHGPLAMIWSLPCHPVASSPPERVSADYIGVVRSKYRSERNLSDDFPFIFLQGPSADLRPAAIGWRSWANPRGILLNLLFGKAFVSFSPAEYSSWADSLADELISNLPDETCLSHPSSLLVERRESPLDELFDFDSPTDRLISVIALKLGKVLLLGFSAEVSPKLSELVEGLFAEESFVLSFTCADDTFGYALTDLESRDLGYEVEGFLPFFGLERKKGVSIERTILDLATQAQARLLSK
jgi:hypothetical protein